jgi:cell wall assembly regulator SMI1
MRGARTIPWLKAVGDAEALGLFSLGVEGRIASSFATLSPALARVDVATMKGQTTPDGRAARIQAALERISRWMNAHGAPLLVENLAPGAAAEQLAQAEAEFEVAVPGDLRALWSLHNGQREEGNGFIEAYNLLSLQWAVAQQETVLMCIEFARESPDKWHMTGGTVEELRSDHWLPFAAQESDSLVVHGVTGRVFVCAHDDAPRLLAPSLAEWLERYASRVAADDYAVEEGFGDYYLELRDREAERRKQDRKEREAEHERFRRETPLLDQFRKALAKKDEERCVEVLKDALDREDTEAFHAAVALLFRSKPKPEFAAGALRPVLSAVVLDPDQWVDVAIGGASRGNNAIRDVAISRCGGASVDRLKQLERAVTAAAEPEHKLLEDVLQRVRANLPGDTAAQADSPPGNWLSRLFGKRPPRG